MKKPSWLLQAQSLDFDPQNAVKARIWSELNRRRVIRWRRPLAWVGCAVFAVAMGAVLTSRLAAPPHAAGILQPGLSEEDCAELTSRYLLAKALTADENDCPCAKQLSSFDRRTVSYLRKGLASVACTACSAQEQARLRQCAVKYPSQIKELRLCKTLC